MDHGTVGSRQNAEGSKPQLESLLQTAVRELASNQCVCGEAKRPKQSFCGACYYSLPRELRNRLYKTLRDGYPEAYDEAKDWLKINTHRLEE
jgi:hypothetical protein